MNLGHLAEKELDKYLQCKVTFSLLFYTVFFGRKLLYAVLKDQGVMFQLTENGASIQIICILLLEISLSLLIHIFMSAFISIWTHEHLFYTLVDKPMLLDFAAPI